MDNKLGINISPRGSFMQGKEIAQHKNLNYRVKMVHILHSTTVDVQKANFKLQKNKQ